MTSLSSMLRTPSFIAFALSTGLAMAQVTLTDGAATKYCSTYKAEAAAGGGTLITLTPTNCLVDAKYSLRVEPLATTQSATTVQSAFVYAEADKDVAAGAQLSLKLCLPEQNNCNSTPGAWYFLRSAELGGAGVSPQDRVMTGTFPFEFKPGLNPSPNNPKSMYLGRMDVELSPLFAGARNVMFSLAGPSAITNVVTHTITGGQQVAGEDLDKYGNVIPNPTATKPPGSSPCEYPGADRYPGTGQGPCGSWEVWVQPPTDPSVNCSNEMTDPINVAWQFNTNYLNEGYVINHFFGMSGSHVMSFRFTTPTTGTYPRIGSIATNPAESWGTTPSVRVSVTEKRCQFSKAALDPATYNACHTRNPNGQTSVRYVIRAEGDNGDPNIPECTLRPGKNYYVNIRFENYTGGLYGCSSSQTCGLVFNMN